MTTHSLPKVPHRSCRQPRAPISRRWIACLTIAVTLLAASACNQPPPTVRLASHIVDQLHPRAHGDLATHNLPQLALGSQTRTLLSPLRHGDTTPVLVHESLEIEVDDGARLEIACAVRPNQLTNGSVRFTITASQAGKAYDVLDELLPVTAHTSGWNSFSIDLSIFEGSISLDFLTEFAPGASASGNAGAALGLFSAPVILQYAPRKRPNIILVSLDTLRAMNLAPYGYERDTAPFMTDFFTTKGQIVERAYSPAADTLYGHTAMLYGREAPAVLRKITKNRIQHVAGAAPLADALRAAGYRTVAFTENANVAADWGFSRGFEIYDEEKSIGSEPGKGSFIRQTFDRGIEWMSRHRDQQLFVFLHTYEVHNPYEPPNSLAQLYPTPTDAGAPRRDLDLYDREIRYTDGEMQRLVGKLEEFGLLDNSILIVTSDHGEEFGEHGGRYHNARLWEEILRVPLFIHAPGILPGGTRRAGPVTLQDIYPTLCELLAIDCPEHLDGRSVAEHLRKGTPVEAGSFVAESRGTLRFTYEGLDPNWTPPANAVVDLPWKLHRTLVDGKHSYELFNLVDDPQERANRYGQPNTPSARLRAVVDEYEALAEQQKAAMVTKYRSVNSGASSTDNPQDAAREKKLRALGYIE